MRSAIRPLLLVTLPLACLSGSAHARGAPPTGDVVDYAFAEPPLNARGVQSLADLRGKPVLIDFWGTR